MYFYLKEYNILPTIKCRSTIQALDFNVLVSSPTLQHSHPILTISLHNTFIHIFTAKFLLVPYVDIKVSKGKYSYGLFRFHSYNFQETSLAINNQIFMSAINLLLYFITRNVRRNLLYLMHLLSMTVKHLTQPLTHVLIGLLS